MAKHIESRRDIFGIFLQRDEVSHKYVEYLLSLNNYTDNQETLARNRRNIFEAPIKIGLIKNTRDKYIATKKLIELRPIMKEHIDNPNCNIEKVIINECKIEDHGMKFIMMHSLNRPSKSNIDRDKAERLLKNFIEYLEMYR